MNEKIDVVLPPIAKAATAWVGVFTGTWLENFGVHTWSDLSYAASFASYAAAFLLSLLFIGDWFWKRFWRDKFVEWGWVKPKLRRRSDCRGDDDSE